MMTEKRKIEILETICERAKDNYEELVLFIIQLKAEERYKKDQIKAKKG